MQEGADRNDKASSSPMPIALERTGTELSDLVL